MANYRVYMCFLHVEMGHKNCKQKNSPLQHVVAHAVVEECVTSPPVVSPPNIIEPVKVVKFAPTAYPLGRAKSSLEPQKSAISHFVARSKSMPLPVRRRADIDLPDETLEEVKVLQQALGRKLGPGECIKEEKISEWFEKNTLVHAFGAQSLSGSPFQARAVSGSKLPNNVGVSCLKGSKGANDTGPNQDNFSVTVIKGGWEIYCVLDGHGGGGHYVSFRGIKSLVYFVCNSKNFPANIHAAIMDGFRACQADLLMHSVGNGYDIQISGAAAVLVVRNAETVWVAHTGDSRVVLGNPNSTSANFETVDHKPTHPTEKIRLESEGAEIHTFSFENGAVEIARVFVKGSDYPGLCMSRSLGDVSVKACGVSAVPDITKGDIKSDDYLILATDGVWEFISSKLVTGTFSRKLANEGTHKCLNRIVTEAKKQWKTNEGNYCDDITAMLIRL